VHSSASNLRAIGLIVRGKLQAIHGSGQSFGGTQTDAEAQPKTYTYRKVNPDGTVTTVLRGSSKDLSCNVIMAIDQADRAVEELEGLLGRPVGWVASLRPGYAGLTAFGVATKSPVIYKTGFAICPITIEGNV